MKMIIISSLHNQAIVTAGIPEYTFNSSLLRLSYEISTGGVELQSCLQMTEDSLRDLHISQFQGLHSEFPDHIFSHYHQQ